jgi:uncharacterized protein YegL
MDKLAKVRPSANPSLEAVLGNLAQQHRAAHALSALVDELIPDPYERMFLLDTSGSMIDKMDELKSGAQEGVKGLRAQEPVTVIAFHSHAETLCRSSLDRGFIKEAIQRLGAAGSTDMVSALELSGRMVADGRSAIIHIVTDGLPDDPKRTLSLARELVTRGHVIRCTGVTGADQAFLNQLAGGEEKRVARVVSTGEFRRALAADFALPPPSRALPRESR